MTQTPETIYLIPGEDFEGGPCMLWCDSPAPGHGMSADDSVKYIRADKHQEIIDRQARAAKLGMDAAKKGALIMEQNARKMLAESSPEALESERAANAVLTDRAEELETALREARANMEDWGNYVPEYFQEKHGLERDLAAIDEVLGGEE